ncbi:hypothetical protein ACKA0G_01420 (plasmid) [Priestia megaterium]|uniref:hypothetical protein n=1 Tax=Priestia megaterium TaxID=1404 RepID=UPI0038A4CF6E
MQNPFQVIEVSSQDIRSIKSSYKNIELPFNHDLRMVLIKLIPLPNTRFKADLSIPYEDFYLDDVLCEGYGKDAVQLLRFTHSKIKFEFDFIKNKFTFSTQEIKSLKQAYLIFGFIHSLIINASELIIMPTNIMDSNVKEEEFSLPFGVEKYKETEIKKDIDYIFNLVKDLISIEKFYRVRFKKFYFNLDKNQYDAIQLLLLRMNGEKETVKGLKVNMGISDLISGLDNFKENVLNSDVNPVSIVYSKGIHIPLFDEVIHIEDKKLTISGPDVIVTNKTELNRQLKKSTKKSLTLRLASKTKQLVRYFD